MSMFEHPTHLILLIHVDIEWPPIEIRSAQDLSDDMKGLIIPGGESTVMGHLLKKNAFLQKIKNWLHNGEDQKFVWGTCAGLILLANQLENAKEGGQCLLGKKVFNRQYFFLR